MDVICGLVDMAPYNSLRISEFYCCLSQYI